MGSGGSSETITIGTAMSGDDLVNAINNLVDTQDNSQVLKAKLDENGYLVIESAKAGLDFNINFTSTANTDVANQTVANIIGLGNVARVIRDGGNTSSNNVEVSATSSAILRSYSLYETTGASNLVERSDLVSALYDNTGVLRGVGINNTNDNFTIGFNGGTAQNIQLFNGTALTIQGFIDAINGNTTINTKIRADFDDATAQITFQVIDSTVTDVQIGFSGNANADAFGLGWGGKNLTVTAANGAIQDNIVLAASSGTLAKAESDYNRIRAQIDALVTDTGYRGTNLLNGDTLTTFFNEDRTSSLLIEGETFTAQGLGLSEATFRTAQTIEADLDRIIDALAAVRSFGTTLANRLAVIQTRKDFTEQTVVTLKAGAGDLTLADQNEEGANLLALQTRQALGVTSLSLASQSQQSVLRLF